MSASRKNLLESALPDICGGASGSSQPSRPLLTWKLVKPSSPGPKSVGPGAPGRWSGEDDGNIQMGGEDMPLWAGDKNDNCIDFKLFF